MVFMLIMPAWALMTDIGNWWGKGQYVLVGVAALMLALEIWLIVEALLLWPKASGVLEKELPPLPPRAATLKPSTG
jgi:carbon starvation protein